jgi:hypothetical protein
MSVAPKRLLPARARRGRDGARRRRESEESMSEIDWSHYPLTGESDLGRRWLQIQCDLGLAQNTVEAYG